MPLCNEGWPAGTRKSALSEQPNCCSCCLPCPGGEASTHQVKRKAGPQPAGSQPAAGGSFRRELIFTSGMECHCSVTSDSLHLRGLSVASSRQECWSGLPFPSPGDLPDSGIEPGSPALQADSLLSELPRKPTSRKDFFKLE